MVQPGHHPSLVPEAGQLGLGSRGPGPEHFEGHLDAEPVVSGPVDDARAPLAQLPQDVETRN